ncbi:hypothetical protein F9288_01785 [Sphingomonas sp. CL5.1]|uniref:hypothetical protein n=1 Tax=Sphingomonas sp. CL5.1 TaxID=2653203 RepID=UPI0015818BA0|nr:hypothetical protein [Sphingomonas sp. CL5.1]QKR98512.1 hypothetical protein F9288_01785 [Sphingomonas sp. CL5.1]
MKPLEPPPRESPPRHRHGWLLFGILAANLFGAAWLIACRLFESGGADERALLFVGALVTPLATFLLIGNEWIALLAGMRDGETRRAPDGDDFVTIWPGEMVPRLRLSRDGRLLPAREERRRALLRGAGFWFAALAGLLTIERLLVDAALLPPARNGAFALAALPFVLVTVACTRRARRGG